MGIRNTKRRRKASKAVPPPIETWEPPPEETWREEVTPCPIGNGYKIVSRDASHADDPQFRPVFFALMLFHQDTGDRELARVDTCHGEVHIHQLHASHPEDTYGHRSLLCPITSQDDVSEWRNKAFEMLQQDADEFRRKWEYE